MNKNRTALALAVGAVTGVGMLPAEAVVVSSGDVLLIDSGVWDAYGIGVAGGSWFGMDTDGNGEIARLEMIAIHGLYGVSIGYTQSAGWIDSWSFFNDTGLHYTTIAPTGTTAGVTMSGWTAAWGDVPTIPLGSGAWTPLNCDSFWMGCTGVVFADGVAAFAWEGNYGRSYSLWYSATVPDGDISGFGGARYVLHLEGQVGYPPEPFPVPAAAWLLGSGLIGLIGAARCQAKG